MHKQAFYNGKRNDKQEENYVKFKQNQGISRRDFLRGTAAGALGRLPDC
ncbi:MAG: twin-arginine translocation signal domain-containing protein [Holdemania massiliensis]